MTKKKQIQIERPVFKLTDTFELVQVDLFSSDSIRIVNLHTNSVFANEPIDKVITCILF